MNLQTKTKAAGRWFLYNVLTHPLSLIVLVSISLFLFIKTSAIATNDDFDARLLGTIAFVFSVIILFMLTNTKWRDWTILSAGLVFVFLAGSLLYAATAYVYFYGPFWFQEDTINFVRASFLTGAFWTLIGLIQSKWLENKYTFGRMKRWIRRPKRMFHRKRDV